MGDLDSWRKLDSLASIGLREAWLWSRAVHRLCDSIEHSTDGLNNQVDAMLLAVAYRNVHRGVTMVAAHLAPERAPRVTEAIGRADEVAGGALKVRDMLEHFDSYEAGTGDEQQVGVHRSKRVPDEDLAKSHQIHYRRDETFTLVVAGHELRVSAVREATRILIDGLHAHA